MRETIFSFINSIGVTSLLRKVKKDSVTVLSLHRISEETDFFFNPIKPHIFEMLLQYCVKEYEVIPFNDLQKKTKKPKLILSFDDGYADFMEYAVPLLSKYCLPSNHNLVNVCLNGGEVIWTQKLNCIFNFLKNNNITDDKIISLHGKSFIQNDKNWIKYINSFFIFLLSIDLSEKQNIIDKLLAIYNLNPVYSMMNWKDAKDCNEKYNVGIGSHTYSHSTVSAIDNQKELVYEIKNSMEELELNLNKRIEILAFPNGQYNKQAVEYCKDIGIKYLLLTNDKINISNQINDDFNLINRIYLVNEGRNETILRTELFHNYVRKIL